MFYTVLKCQSLAYFSTFGVRVTHWCAEINFLITHSERSELISFILANMTRLVEMPIFHLSLGHL